MRAAGKTDLEITAELKTAGWAETDITSAFNPQSAPTVDNRSPAKLDLQRDNMENQFSTSTRTQLQNPANQTTILIIILWFLVFAPIGFYLLWKEKRLHIWFPNLLIILGILSVIPVFPIFLFVIPKLIKLYENFGADYNKSTPIIFAIAILTITFIQIVTGFILRKKVNPDGSLKNLYIYICLGFSVFQFISIGLFVLAFILQIYNLTSQF